MGCVGKEVDIEKGRSYQGKGLLSKWLPHLFFSLLIFPFNWIDPKADIVYKWWRPTVFPLLETLVPWRLLVKEGMANIAKLDKFLFLKDLEDFVC